MLAVRRAGDPGARTSPIAAIGDLRPEDGSSPIRGRARRRSARDRWLGIAVGVFGFSAGHPINQAVAVTFVGGFIVFLGLVVLRR